MATHRRPRPTAPASASDAHVCCVVPPFLLARLAERGDGEAARVARETLAVQRPLSTRREARTGLRPAGSRPDVPSGPGDDAGFVPRSLRRHPGAEPRRDPVRDTTARAGDAGPTRTIHDAEHRTTLPGVVRRSEGEPPHADESVNEAYDGLGATWALYHDVYGRDSLDGAGLPLVASVHFEHDYDNAFWDGEQMVFGDGDGEVFGSFTDAVDVIGHELTHGFTQHTAGFVYLGQSGALNEHVSDVFGVLTVQYARQQPADEADWLVGKGLFTDKVKGVALRSMKAPGTAYDDPVLGTDPQPARMADYQDLPHDEKNDNGGVHINSGIPNRAFYLAATAIGGNAWETAGQVWFDTMTRGGLPKDCDFAAFAAATVRSAGQRFGDGGTEQEAIRTAWSTVGVDPGAAEPAGETRRAPGRHRRP